uniref:4Fe-4S ferredoxin-type domain-containing protein n=1 Tax=Strongyloides stercoralis TaxID=6248 RepID=A0A0K0EJU5_STRER
MLVTIVKPGMFFCSACGRCTSWCALGSAPRYISNLDNWLCAKKVKGYISRFVQDWKMFTAQGMFQNSIEVYRNEFYVSTALLA